MGEKSNISTDALKKLVDSLNAAINGSKGAANTSAATPVIPATTATNTAAAPVKGGRRKNRSKRSKRKHRSRRYKRSTRRH